MFFFTYDDRLEHSLASRLHKYLPTSYGILLNQRRGTAYFRSLARRTGACHQ